MTDNINALLRQVLRQHAENCVEFGTREFDSKTEAESAIVNFINENIDDLEDQVIEFVVQRFAS